MTTASSYLSSSDVRHCGLGADTEAATVEIRWPSSTVQRLTPVTDNRYVRGDEPTGGQFGPDRR